MYNNNYNWYQPPAPLPGKHEATVAMVLGIVSCALLVFGYTALGSVVTGIIGLIYSAPRASASTARRARSGMSARSSD